MFRIENIIFDLDGTLIDSAPIILDGFRNILDKFGYKPQLEINNNLIGPPLIKTIQILSGENSEDKLNDMVLNFKVYYDSEACTRSLPYPGVNELLEFLKIKKIKLHIATNKRNIPTWKILNKLNWNLCFHSIYSIDSYKNLHFNDKSHMLQELLKKENLKREKIVYIGDRFEDKTAAQENNIEFWLAEWGYGDYKDLSNYSQVYASPKEIENYISSMI
jgi:phosphoglycolate phosphatase